jgi:nifR3 family TIM-barrel protein
MRSLALEFGAGLVFTEVANAQGLVHGSKPTRHLLETFPGEHPVAGHIYGSDPGIMARAAILMEELNRFSFIDINCGCPVRKIVAKGAGAALIRDPARIAAIVSAVGAAISIPVTVKTRIGFSPDMVNISEIAHAAEEAGAAAISIHGRLACHHHRGPSAWDIIARVKSERTIPVIGNGGVDRAEDVPVMFAETGVDAVMIGRGAVGNPWIFRKAHALMHGLPYEEHSLSEHRAVIAEQLNRLITLKKIEYRFRKRASVPAEQSAALHFRAHLFRYFAGFRDWADVRRELNTMNTPERIMEAVDRVLARQKP